MAFYPTSILVAVDGSPASDKAVDVASEMAACTNSELHLVHVGLLSYWTHPDTLSPTQYQQLETEARRRLDKEAEKARNRGITVTRTHLRMGRVDAEIIGLADELAAGMIVIGNRGVGAIQRILLGNDSESVVRHAEIPVLVVR